MIIDAQEYLYEWEKANNPFYPNEMKWDRLTVNKFLCDYKQQLPIASHAVLGEGWRDARKELPEHEDYYLVATHWCPIDGYKYAVIKYNKGSDIWNNFKAWRKIDPPAFA